MSATRFTQALARLPGHNYADGLSRVDLGKPSFDRVLEQHGRYLEALVECGVAVTTLPADPAYPDGTFVEDTAVLVPGGAILTRPGADSREGEVDAVAAALARDFPEPARILAPGTLDGGDICETDDHVFIGLSHRTNAEGARQLAGWLATKGLGSTVVDIRGLDSILHLKSGLAWLGEGRLLVIEELAGHPAFAGRECVRVDAGEAYAANAIRVNERVLIAAGYPRLQARLRDLGYAPLALEMGEFAKMDGGLSCLSLRY